MPNEKTKKTKSALKVTSAIIIALAIFSAVIFFAIKLQKQKETITLAGTTLHVERASSTTEKQRGLCCRDFLAADSGMLFTYDQPGDYRFWMKDTYIPLDIIWLSSQKKVVHIEHNVQPSSYPQKFSSPLPAQYVLETNGGWSKVHQLRVGDSVAFE